MRICLEDTEFDYMASFIRAIVKEASFRARHGIKSCTFRLQILQSLADSVVLQRCISNPMAVFHGPASMLACPMLQLVLLIQKVSFPAVPIGLVQEKKVKLLRGHMTLGLPTN